MAATTRLTNHNGRKGKDGVYSAKHNDRNYDVKHSKHIDPTRSSGNKTWHYYPDDNLTFEQAEQRFYQEMFDTYPSGKNERYIKGRHPERVQTMDEYRKNERSCPEETIIQVGSIKDGSISPDELWELCLEQIEWQKQAFPNVIVLDIALHVDEEGAPHLHERKVWVATDENGVLYVNQNKALEVMGIERPDTSKKKDRHNNPKMTYSQLIRNHFIELCKSHGIDIEEEPKEASQTGLTLTEFKFREEKKKLIETEQKLAEITEELGKAIEERDMAVEESAVYKADAEIKIEQLSDIVDNYLKVNKKKKLLREDTYEMSREEYEKFQEDKVQMAENARIILDAENINKKRTEVMAVRREYAKYSKLKEAEEIEHKMLSEQLPKMRAEKEELQTFIKKNVPEKMKAIEQSSRLSLLEGIVADAGKALTSLDKFLNDYTDIKYHSKIRELVRTVANILSKASEKSGNARENELER